MKFIIESELFKKIKDSVKPFVKNNSMDKFNRVWCKVSESKLDILVINENDDILIKNIEIQSSDDTGFVFGFDFEVLNFIETLLTDSHLIFENNNNYLTIRNNSCKIDKIAIDSNFDERCFDFEESFNAILSAPKAPILQAIELVKSIKTQWTESKLCRLIFDNGLRLLFGNSEWLLEQKIDKEDCRFSNLNEKMQETFQTSLRPSIFETVEYLYKIWDMTDDNFNVALNSKASAQIKIGELEIYSRFALSNVNTKLEATIDRFETLPNSLIEIDSNDWLKAHKNISFMDKKRPIASLFIENNAYEGFKLSLSKDCELWIKPIENIENLKTAKWDINLTGGIDKEFIKTDTLSLFLYSFNDVEPMAFKFQQNGLTYIWGLLK